MSSTTPRVAVLVPCLDEERTIAAVVEDFRAALPEAIVYVYDNASTDGSAAAAAAAGAVVRHEPLRGKGHVVRRMFADVDADIYLLVDGDRTYDAASAPRLVRRLEDEGLDMVVGCRIADRAGDGGEGEAAYPRGHRFGNRLFTGTIARLFGDRFRDVLSGYRCFSRRFVKSFPVSSDGFEIETELTVHGLSLRLPCAEIDTPYRRRPAGSESKLGTFRDGWRILKAIVVLLKEHRPLAFFGALAAFLATLSLALGIPVVLEFVATGLVPRFPTAILATGIMILAFLFGISGVLLDSTARMRREIKLLAYLAQPAPQSLRSGDLSA